jgi:hypothetical protein
VGAAAAAAAAAVKTSIIVVSPGITNVALRFPTELLLGGDQNDNVYIVQDLRCG